MICVLLTCDGCGAEITRAQTVPGAMGTLLNTGGYEKNNEHFCGTCDD